MFIDEISKLTGLPLGEAFNDYKIINIAGKAIYVQNYIKLLNYLPEKINLKIKANEIVIEGSNLKIAELGGKNILVTGNVFKTYLAKEVKKNAKNK